MTATVSRSTVRYDEAGYIVLFDVQVVVKLSAAFRAWRGAARKRASQPFPTCASPPAASVMVRGRRCVIHIYHLTYLGA
jgi:hypothetical protein